MDIPRDPSKLKPLRRPSYRNSDGDEATITFSTNAVALLSMLHERGIYSRHVYQPSVNPRSLDVVRWNKCTKDESGSEAPPMKEALAQPTNDRLNFSEATPMNLFFYSIRPSEATSGCQLKSHTQLHVPKKDNPNEYETLEAFISNINASTMTMSDLKRLFMIFNHRYMDEDGSDVADTEQVRVTDLKAFADLVEETDLSTVDGFNRTVIQAFEMQDIFPEMDTSLDLEDVLTDFSDTLRALVVVRACCYEGQHRWTLVTVCITGHYSASNIVPLRRVDFYDHFKYLGVKPGDRDKSQMFSRQNICILPRPEVPLDDDEGMLSKVEEKGQKSSLAQDLRAKEGFKDVIWALSQVITSMLRGKISSGHDALTYDNFWCDENLERFKVNCSALLAQLQKLLESKPGLLAYLRGQHNTDAPAEQMIKTAAKFNQFSWLTPGLATRQMKKNETREFVLVCEFLRLAVFDLRFFAPVARMFSSPLPAVDQVPVPRNATILFNFNWINHYIFGAHNQALRTYRIKAWIERKFLEGYVHRVKDKTLLKEWQQTLSRGEEWEPLSLQGAFERMVERAQAAKHKGEKNIPLPKTKQTLKDRSALSPPREKKKKSPPKAGSPKTAPSAAASKPPPKQKKDQKLKEDEHFNKWCLIEINNWETGGKKEEPGEFRAYKSNFESKIHFRGGQEILLDMLREINRLGPNPDLKFENGKNRILAAHFR